MAVSIYTPTNSARMFVSPYHLHLFCRLSDDGHSDWCEVISHCGFDLHFSNINLYAEYIVRNTGLEETQAGIKIAGRNINNLRYADDTTLMAESE